MPELVNCPQCERKLRVPEDLLGKEVKCPSCGTTFPAVVADEVAEDVSAHEAPPEPEPADKPAPDKGIRRRVMNEDEDEENEEPRSRRRRSRGRLEPHRGTAVLVLGIVSLVILPFIFGPIAWVMGNNDLRAIRAGRMDPEGEGLTNAGRICGIIGTILGALQLLCCVAYLCIFGAAALSGALSQPNARPPIQTGFRR